MSEVKSKCNICEGEFEIAAEGGVNGVIGTFITFSLCPTCYNGMCDMVEQNTDQTATCECPECGHEIKLKVEIVDD